MKSFPAFFLILSLLTALPAAGQPIMSEIWQRHWNDGQLFDPQDPHHHPDADPDNDGWTNATEAIAGTNPFDANSPHGFLRLDIRHVPAVWVVDPLEEEPLLHSPEGFEIQCIEESTPGKTYQLFFSEDLSPNSWIAVGNPISGAGDSITLVVNPQYEDHDPFAEEDPLLPPRGFWRLAISETFHDDDNDGLISSDEWLLGSSPWLADTDDNGIDDLTQYQSGQPPAGANGAGTPGNQLYSVVFEILQESRMMPRHVGFLPLAGPTATHRHLTMKRTETYSVSGSPLYPDVSGGVFQTTSTFLDGSTITADGEAVHTTTGQPFAEWKAANEVELAEGEAISWDTSQTTTETPPDEPDETQTTITTTRSWEVEKDGDVIRSGTETIVENTRTTLHVQVNWRQFLEQHVRNLPWVENPQGASKYGPLHGVEMNLFFLGPAAAAEIVRSHFRQDSFPVSAVISDPFFAPSAHGGSEERIKSMRWRWVRFNPRNPFHYEYAVPPAEFRKTFRFPVWQHDTLSEDFPPNSPLLHERALVRGILQLECAGGVNGWQDVPAALYNAHAIEDPEYHNLFDFGKKGGSRVDFNYLLPMEFKDYYGGNHFMDGSAPKCCGEKVSKRMLTHLHPQFGSEACVYIQNGDTLDIGVRLPDLQGIQYEMVYELLGMEILRTSIQPSHETQTINFDPNIEEMNPWKAVLGAHGFEMQATLEMSLNGEEPVKSPPYKFLVDNAVLRNAEFKTKVTPLVPGSKSKGSYSEVLMGLMLHEVSREIVSLVEQNTRDHTVDPEFRLNDPRATQGTNRLIIRTLGEQMGVPGSAWDNAATEALALEQAIGLKVWQWRDVIFNQAFPKFEAIENQIRGEGWDIYGCPCGGDEAVLKQASLRGVSSDEIDKFLTSYTPAGVIGSGVISGETVRLIKENIKNAKLPDLDKNFLESWNIGNCCN